MKKILIAVTGVVMMASCSNEKEQAMNQSQYDAKVDSLVGEKMNDLFMQSMEDRDRRISIEVKPKADSIVAAWQAANK